MEEQREEDEATDGFADELLSQGEYKQLYEHLRKLDACSAEQCAVRANEAAAATSAMASASPAATAQLRSSNPCFLLWRPPASTSLSTLRLLFRALLSSLALFSLPHVHLSIMLGRLAVLLPHSAMSAASSDGRSDDAAAAAIATATEHLRGARHSAAAHPSSPFAHAAAVTCSPLDTNAAMMLQAILQQQQQQQRSGALPPSPLNHQRQSTDALVPTAGSSDSVASALQLANEEEETKQRGEDERGSKRHKS